MSQSRGAWHHRAARPQPSDVNNRSKQIYFTTSHPFGWCKVGVGCDISRPLSRFRSRPLRRRTLHT